MSISAAIKSFILSIVIAVLSACGGGGGGSDGNDTTTATTTTTTTTPAATNIGGGGVKGPLANAIVTVYAFDAAQPGFKGAVVATATTNASAAISGLALPFPVTPPYILEFTSDAGTTDITTQVAPVITTMRTVITQSLLDSGEQIYATPLTTMAVDIAVANAQDTNGTTGIQADEFASALTTAAAQVVSTLGFGMDSSIDIFDTPPLVDSTTDSAAAQADVAAYRTAVEAVTAIAFQINQQTADGNTDSVLAELSADLADGGGIDGSAGDQINANTLQVFEQDPATLPIPRSGGPGGAQTVGDVQAILVAETATTGTTTSTTELDLGGSITTEAEPAELDPDLDGDGVLNADDAYPNDATADTDSDGDGAPDVAYTDASRSTVDTVRSDADDDNDGWTDGLDDYPLDDTRFLDPALDRDSDTVANGSDNCALISNTDQADTDGDGQGDACSNDNDGDGVDDSADNCPLIANPGQEDLDLDEVTGGGDACDADIDGDLVLNGDDAFPLDSNETVDTDGDGIGNETDADDDNDNVADLSETGRGLDGSTPCSLLRDCDGDGVFDGADFAPTDPAVTYNFAPVANDDTANLDEDATTFSIAVTANDTDDDGNPNDSVSLDSIGSNDTALGTAVPNGNNIDYTPVADASGTDTFTYTVTDGSVTSTASVTVTVNAVNDTPVVVAAGPFLIDEDVANATLVGTITANDVDSTISGYSITAGNTDDAFAIDAGGQVTVADTSAIDSETSTSFTLSVTATDGVNTSAAEDFTINVTDVNDTAPVIGAAQVFSVAEDAIDTSVVGTVNATDADTVGAVTAFTIESGDAGGAFAIDAGGQITVADTSAIDFENSTSFTLSVTATDSMNPSAAVDVTIDVTDANDTAPVIGAAQVFSVVEDAIDTAVVGTVSATDADTVGTITAFTIESGDAGGAFAIDAGGQITVADTSAIDFENSTSFTLSVTATDGVNTSAAADVTVNVTDANDTAPVIGAAQVFSVAEDAIDTSVVGTVNATDADTVGAVTAFTIESGDAGGAFAIDAGGQITVADTSAIDFENSTSFTLSVTATDSMNPSAAVDVTVNVTDANDTAPVIGAAQVFSVVEDAIDTAVVGTVSATDADTVGTITAFTIESGDAGGAFAIDAGGQITVADTSAIDFENSTSFTLSVTATDSMNTSAAVDVTVNVTDANDTAPVVDAVGPFALPENSAVSTAVGTVTATDADTAGAVTSFTIESGDAGGAFAIDANGNITVANTAALDRETTASFSLIVTATDGTNTSVGEGVIVNLSDVNDSAPVITASQVFAVNSIATNGTVVGTVAATDADTTGAITAFTIESGDTTNAFTIGNDGEITVLDNSALQANAPYTLSITATDGVNGSSTPESVTINVSTGGAVWDQFNWDDGSTWQ